jgi:hypothetical protein
MDIKYRVNYFESEQGWGSDTWNVDVDTSEHAHKLVEECNAKNTSPTAPSYYIVASYVGPVEV